MLKKISLGAVLFISLFSTAQKPVYRSYNYGGLLAGDHDGYQVLTTHGLATGSYFFGLGAGFDQYRKSSFPVFATVSKYLFPSTNNLFINMNGGTSIVPRSEMGSLPGASASSFKPRFFGEAGLAYRFQLKNMKARQGVLFGAYYSYKGISEKFTVPGGCGNPSCGDQYEYIDYQLNRWAFKVGVAL